MELYNTNGFTIAVVVATVGYKWVKYWYTKNDLVKEYIKTAGDIQRHVERDNVIDIDEVICDVDITPSEQPKKKVRHHGLFKSYLVQLGKAKFGTPTQTKANELVVRKYLYDACREHGVISRHIVSNLDFAVQMVFVPNKEELLAKAVKCTHLTKFRNKISEDLGAPTLFD